jgi:hypothetical protein
MGERHLCFPMDELLPKEGNPELADPGSHCGDEPGSLFPGDGRPLRLRTGEPEALQSCFQVFSPLLFALAERAQVVDSEGAVEAILRDLETHHQAWPRSGLRARVWVTGMAQRRLQFWCQPSVQE